MQEKFSWKAGTQFPVDAEVAADTIRNLQRTLGKDTITAKELLDESRAVDAPLHSCFEWDDTVAAEKYRLEQSRKLIGSIEITYVKNDTPEHLARTRYFFNTVKNAPQKQGAFATIDVVLKNPDYRKQVLSNALIELRNFQRKYNNIQELSGVHKAIDAFADAIQ